MVERVLSEPGSCPRGQAPAGLDASRCDPSRGDWVLFRWSDYERVKVELRQVEKVTPKLVKFAGPCPWPRQCTRLNIVGVLPTKEAGMAAQQAIAGIAGEFEQRRRAAEDERSRRQTEAVAAANRKVDAAIASAIASALAQGGDA